MIQQIHLLQLIYTSCYEMKYDDKYLITVGVVDGVQRGLEAVELKEIQAMAVRRANPDDRSIPSGATAGRCRKASRRRKGDTKAASNSHDAAIIFLAFSRDTLKLSGYRMVERSTEMLSRTYTWTPGQVLQREAEY
ncbi:hypothetical protein F7725_022151 [Dissostichus mawsoni]|uniref:Uncharacterized protein n=1 Tax=Dissostichus mawsoni TaxID=36200 RepID=A0A7J5ZD44_DISMA|nr:hypothetical protein F7725_022151 [Dissostichus mawsoni]